MELAGKSPQAICLVSQYVVIAKIMADFIDDPAAKVGSGRPLWKAESIRMSQFYEDVARFYEHFPEFCGFMQETKPDLFRLTREERFELKLRLLDEVRQKVFKTKDEIYGRKTLHTQPLPDDIRECLLRLDEMKNAEYARIKEIAERIRQIDCARDLIETRMMDNKEKLFLFDENSFTSMPVGKERSKTTTTAPERAAKKRQRRGEW
jgi:hypothetical protein